MITLDKVQRILVGMMHFKAGGGELQEQIGRVAESAIVVDCKGALEVADFRALQKILVLQHTVVRLTWLSIESQDLVMALLPARIAMPRPNATVRITSP